MSDNNADQSTTELSIDGIMTLVDNNGMQYRLNEEVTSAIRHDILAAYSDTPLADLKAGGVVNTKKLLAQMYKRCDGGHSDLMLIVGVEEVIRHFAAVHQLGGIE